MGTEANDPMLFRDWEDSLKEKENTIHGERRIRKMSLKDWKNNELSENLNKKWGFKMDLGKLNEAHCAGKRNDDNVDEAHCAGKRDDGVKEETIEEGEIPDDLRKHIEKQKAKKKGKEEGDENEKGDSKGEKEKKKGKKSKQFANDPELDGDGDGNPKWAAPDDPANKS